VSASIKSGVGWKEWLVLGEIRWAVFRTSSVQGSLGLCVNFVKLHTSMQKKRQALRTFLRVKIRAGRRILGKGTSESVLGSNDVGLSTAVWWDDVYEWDCCLDSILYTVSRLSLMTLRSTKRLRPDTSRFGAHKETSRQEHRLQFPADKALKSSLLSKHTVVHV
jgi:hypothetical protein